MQIRKKLPIVLNILICMPLAILTLVNYIYSSHKLMVKGESYIEQLTVSEGRALETMVEAKSYQVTILAADKRVVEVLRDEMNLDKKKNAANYLKAALIDQDDCELVLINKQGKVILTGTGNEEINEVKNIEKFKNVLEGNIEFGDMLLDDVNERKVINITVPVFDEEHHVIGAVCKVIYNDVFSDFIRDVKIDNTGLGLIVDDMGYIVAYCDRKKEGKLIENEAVRNEVLNKFYSNQDRGTFYFTMNNKKLFVSYYDVPKIGWTIYIYQNLSEMRGPADIGGLIGIGTLILLIGIVNIASKRLTNKITRPIDILMTTMDDNKNGDYSKCCPYDGEDEFGMLAMQYNEMIRCLGESKEALAVSEERYKTTLNAIDGGIWEYHAVTKEFFATENMTEIIGDLKNSRDIVYFMREKLEPQVIKSFMQTLNRCLLGEISDFTQEARLWVHGEQKWILCKGHAVKLEHGRVEKVIGIVTDITDNKKNEERVRKLSFFDDLTGCLNKATFIESMDGWLSSDEIIKDAALLFIDLDNFKRINDTQGHEIGDKLLNAVGKMIREILPADAFIGRFGGDEFVIFKSDVSDVQEVNDLIYTILNLFNKKVEVDNKKVHLTCSMGVAMYPVDGRDSTKLLKNADTAMYKAKENGKNSCSFYAPSMTQTLDRRLLIEDALRDAISNNSFQLQYQPIVDIHTNKTVGCEALIRLVDSELGFISPGEFIPIAEETDLIIASGDWVMEKALETLAYYHEIGFKDFCININVSSIQMKEPNFLSKLKAVIEKTKVPMQAIKLEVTETVLMENIEASRALFDEIKAMGIKLALDDFGTGYSSLNYLRNIPLDVLKIDKSFVDEITTSKVLSEIVDSIISMAHALDITVVAEGVETENQLAVLREKGCDLIQGYYYSKPLNLEVLEMRLESEQFQVNHSNKDHLS